METIRDLQSLRASDTHFPTVLFVHTGTENQGTEIIGGLWPEARAIADPGGQFYGAFGLRGGSIVQLAGPKALWRAFLAFLKGHRQGRVAGDPRVMPGMFLIRDGSVVWSHRSAYNGDRPEYDSIPRDPA